MSQEGLCLVSPCIIGVPTRWDGGQYVTEALIELAAAGRLLPYCAEVAGGLSIPRGDASIQAFDGERVLFRQATDVDGHDVLDGRAKVVTKEEKDVTSEYLRGAKQGLALAQTHGTKIAILKAYSPSCGSQRIYDGTFTLTLKPGKGVLAALLERNGITVYSDEQVKENPRILARLVN
jgi:uncharacterized protein YbbK (DUF523 family)